MGKAALRNLMAHKGRLALSVLAVVLSASAFVAGTLIFTDTLKASFDDLFAQTASDVVVSPPDTDGPSSDGSDGSSVVPATVPAAALETVRSTDGIAGRRRRRLRAVRHDHRLGRQAHRHRRRSRLRRQLGAGPAADRAHHGRGPCAGR